MGMIVLLVVLVEASDLVMWVGLLGLLVHGGILIVCGG